MTIAQLDGLSLGGGSEVALAARPLWLRTKVPFISRKQVSVFPGPWRYDRTERHIGPELTKYYVLLERQSLRKKPELGIVIKLVDPTEINDATNRWPQASSIYAPREIPAKYDELKKVSPEKQTA